MTMNENDKQAEPVAVDHSDLIKRIDAAIERVTQGRGLMSIPADPRSDVDLVLSECKALLQGENPPFWATDFHPAQPVQPAGAQGEAVGEIQIEDIGKPFNAMRVRVHFYKEVPPVGAKIYTAPPAAAINEQTLSELKNMVRAYVRLLEAGKDRIESLGGDCDPVDRMEAGDSNLRTAKAAIAAAEAAKGGV